MILEATSSAERPRIRTVLRRDRSPLLIETARLATAQGANPLTLMGLAGLGDLVATCSSPLSRNRSFGEKLGKGMTT